ncbi:3',5'-cyclic-AMP phosphodiesterase [Candidatus Methylobacter oryzae]|uniref:3',5'-cyclic-AMP phosphodiesterase n=2 Tax=Candidatus Methylobacter oryzae TaxID=2497749 RepID=A0ABY3CHB3_9GAMM|nr:3',5'-cyclic-AMP phosphodiesterase [Candidatus Methylobacter oryzae]TRX02554.1 3',5'-cyclic-AMP phosphodiesterase [Candidatus Methylobacter oryzae]
MMNNPASISILQLSDSHIMKEPDGKLLGINTEHYFHACLEQAFRLSSRQALAEKPYFDLILFTGDLAQEPCPESYRRILSSLEPYRTPCICLPGNHDDYELMQRVLNTDKVNCRKQVILDNWQLISLNSQIPGEAGGRLAEEELAFLEECLIKIPDRHALIAVHHHLLETKSPWMDAMIIENSQELLAITAKYPQVKVITTGHIHQVMDVRTSTLRILGAPSTCFQFTPEAPDFSVSETAPGYRLIELYADGQVESEVVRLPGSLPELRSITHGY